MFFCKVIYDGIKILCNSFTPNNLLSLQASSEELGGVFPSLDGRSIA